MYTTELGADRAPLGMISFISSAPLEASWLSWSYGTTLIR